MYDTLRARQQAQKSAAAYIGLSLRASAMMKNFYTSQERVMHIPAKCKINE
ncbi:unnamed protein product [Trichogramma brassicae]|uniref:Uncharacterized protein n=1 Tax=Trichogramma brassicae TaxID=86971 RepID=A0A6H5IKZ9_9HYME|nr:unnamed protein product [Trichogramma brassicae]